MATPSFSAQQYASSFYLSPIKAIELAASKIPGSVSLAQGIPSFETPAVLREFVFEKVRAGLCDKYSLTTGLTELREEIAQSLATDGMVYNPDTEILVTAGSIEGITATLLALTSPGDEVLLPSPTYTSYVGALHVARCTPRFVPLNEEKNFEFQIEKIESCITRKTKLLLFSSPNNPTGTIFREANVRALCALALKHNITLLIDEVYKDFYYTNEQHFSPAHIPEVRNHVVRVCSFSKAYSMTGWRVGFLHAPQKIIAQILKYHDAMVTCAPVVSQYAAIAAIRFGAPFLAECQEILRRRRSLTINRLDQLSQLLDYQVPEAAYFAFPRIKDSVPYARESVRLAYDILEKTGLALVPGAAFGPSGESHLRITFGRSDRELEDGLTRFAEYLTKTGSRKTIAIGSETQPLKPKQNRAPLLRQLAQPILAFAARVYLQRSQPTIIGIAGSRGKTVVKRVLGETLATLAPTRTTLLSYNTQIGLPLSVLQLPSPQKPSEYLGFIAKLFHRMFVFRGNEKYLVLEYGVSNAEDARDLLQIATPHWLVLTSISQLDPSVTAEDFLAGITTLCKALPPSRILWPKSDPLSKNLALELLDANDISPDPAADQIEGISESNLLAERARVLLLSKLSVEV